jgi:hypothetical protein
MPRRGLRSRTQREIWGEASLSTHGSTSVIFTSHWCASVITPPLATFSAKAVAVAGPGATVCRLGYGLFTARPSHTDGWLSNGPAAAVSSSPTVGWAAPQKPRSLRCMTTRAASATVVLTVGRLGLGVAGHRADSVVQVIGDDEQDVGLIDGGGSRLGSARIEEHRSSGHDNTKVSIHKMMSNIHGSAIHVFYSGGLNSADQVPPNK